MIVESQDLSHEDAVEQLREALQGVGDWPPVMVVPSKEIVVDQVKGSTGVDPPPFQVSS